MSKFNIYYKLKSEVDNLKPAKVILLTPFVFILGCKNGYTLGKGHMADLPNGWSIYTNIDEKTAKKIYARMLATNLFDLKLEKIK